jgi:hypothetical protein
MKKALALSLALAAPVALSMVAVVPNVVFLIASIFLPLPAFIFEVLVLGGTAFLGTTLFGVILGHNITTSLIQGFIIGL